ncbi:hypothetical protein TSOC_009742, partial [Tetrabaena socialis]
PVPGPVAGVIPALPEPTGSCVRPTVMAMAWRTGSAQIVLAAVGSSARLLGVQPVPGPVAGVIPALPEPTGSCVRPTVMAMAWRTGSAQIVLAAVGSSARLLGVQPVPGPVAGVIPALPEPTGSCVRPTVMAMAWRTGSAQIVLAAVGSSARLLGVQPVPGPVAGVIPALPEPTGSCVRPTVMAMAWRTGSAQIVLAAVGSSARLLGVQPVPGPVAGVIPALPEPTGSCVRPTVMAMAWRTGSAQIMLATVGSSARPLGVDMVLNLGGPLRLTATAPLC